jgi:hypothetical protein
MKASALIKKLWYYTSPTVKIVENGKVKLNTVIHSCMVEESEAVAEFCDAHKYSVNTFVVADNTLTIHVKAR